MSGTDPATFDPESTGTFRVQPLADALVMGEPTVERDYTADIPIAVPVLTPPAWLGTTGPALFYADDLGNTVRVDSENYITHPGPDATDQHHRQRLLLRALLQHTLAMLNGEDVS